MYSEEIQKEKVIGLICTYLSKELLEEWRIRNKDCFIKKYAPEGANVRTYLDRLFRPLKSFEMKKKYLNHFKNMFSEDELEYLNNIVNKEELLADAFEGGLTTESEYEGLMKQTVEEASLKLKKQKISSDK